MFTINNYVAKALKGNEHGLSFFATVDVLNFFYKLDVLN